MMLGKVAWCSVWLGQWRIKQGFVDVICLWPAGGNLDGIHATGWYLTIYPFQLRRKRPTRVILENHGCKFTHSCETAVKPTCVCVFKDKKTKGKHNMIQSTAMIVASMLIFLRSINSTKLTLNAYEVAYSNHIASSLSVNGYDEY
jgi:hypothetical protein